MLVFIILFVLTFMIESFSLYLIPCHYSFELAALKSSHGQFTWEHGLLLSLVNIGLKWIRSIWPQRQLSGLDYINQVKPFTTIVFNLIHDNQSFKHAFSASILKQLIRMTLHIVITKFASWLFNDSHRQNNRNNW